MCESVRQKLGHTKIHFWGYRKEQDTALLQGQHEHGQVAALYHKKIWNQSPFEVRFEAHIRSHKQRKDKIPTFFNI